MRTFVAFLLAFAVAGCGAEHDHDHDHETEHAGHQHVAPHEGLLVELGNHAANIEFVFDAKKGELIAYLLGPHAEQPVRSDAESLDVTVQVGNKWIAMKLMPVATAVSGEKVGDTSTFRGQAAVLIGAKTFTGRVGPLRLRGVDFETTAFTWPAD
jgi:hypothetical protein